jgi:hypothetical protein
MLFGETVAIYYWEREREREREGGGGSDRHHAGGDGNINFLFEGFQAMPASPSDKGEILFKVVAVRGAAVYSENYTEHSDTVRT